MSGLLWPAYIAPPNSAFSTVIGLAVAYPSVPVTVILNPNSGPDTSAHAAYTTVISQLHAAGARVIGYVHTSYSARSIAVVEAEVDSWKAFYPTIDGIFVDEMDNTAPNVSYYVALTSYIHGHGLGLVVGNPGTNTVAEYFSNPTADVIVINESAAAWPSPDQTNNSGLGTRAQHASVVYGISYDETKLRFLSQYNGWVWLTDDTLPNPYDTIPTYLSSVFQNLSASYAIGGIRLTATLKFQDMTMGRSDVTVNVLGTAYTERIQVVGTSPSPLSIGEVSVPGYAFIKNNNSTGYVDIYDHLAGNALVRILPGEFALFRCATIAPAIAASVAGVEVEYLIVES